MKKENLVKVFALSFLMIATTMLVGCGEKNTNEAGIKNENKVAEKNEGLMSGIKNMIESGKTMKCVTEDAGNEWVTYTNGKNFRGEGLVDGKKQRVIFTEETTYTWNETTKVGQKINAECLNQFQKDMGIEGNVVNATEPKEDFSVEKLEAEEQAGKVKCSPVTGVDFSVPSDVEFTDQCEVMRKQMQGFEKQMQNFKQLNKK